MFSNDHDFQEDLIKHKVYTAWQFIHFTNKNIETVRYCAAVINNIIDKMENKTIRWEQDLFSDLADDVDGNGRAVKRVTVTADNFPQYEIRVAGVKVNPWFLFDKLVRDFYQYSVNSLDSMSQIANAGLLANKGKKVDAVDFQRMKSCFAQETYRSAFPKTSAWFDKVGNSDEFKYIEAINNRTKHTYDIANKLSMGILGCSGTAEIGPFFRKEVQHDRKSLIAQLDATIDFLERTWTEFLTAFTDEYVLDTYVENRRHCIGGVYQQRIKEDSTQDLAYAFFDVENNFESMPDEIYVLLVNDKEDIAAHECPFDTILVIDQSLPLNILGGYKVEEAVGDDCLLTYRKYVKSSEHWAILLHEIQSRAQTFYHWNPFFNIKAVSDDKKFLTRSNMPF